MILHTVNKSSFTNPCLADCLTLCAAGDAIVLIEEGVYTIADSALKEIEQPVYALQADLQARGLSDKVPATVQIINDDEFVALTIKHDKVVSWF